MGPKKAKIYLIGDPDFFLAVDHKPLLKILGDRRLADIDNPRLFKFKERTLPFSYTIVHIPGIHNTAANSLSRNPSDTPDTDDIRDINEIEKYASFVVYGIVTSNLTISAEDVKKVGKTDIQYTMLLEKVNLGTFANTQTCENANIRNYFNVKDRLSVVNGLLLYTLSL